MSNANWHHVSNVVKPLIFRKKGSVRSVERVGSWSWYKTFQKMFAPTLDFFSAKMWGRLVFLSLRWPCQHTINRLLRVLHSLFSDDLSLVRFVSFWKKRAKSEQAKSNHLQGGSSKSVCAPVLWSNEHQFCIFWALLVQFGLGKFMCKEGFQELWILGFFRSKRLTLEMWKIWGMDVEMAPYLRKYQNLVKEVYWWNVVCCMGVWVVTFDF